MNLAEAVPPAVVTSLVQREGQRPPGLPRELRDHPAWERLRRQIYARAIRFGAQLSFDFRELLTDAENARDAGLLMWRLIRPLAPQVLVGPGFGATPLLYATALAALADGHSLQVLMVRDQRKDHNKKRWVEGHHESARGRRAVMLDDFMQAGSALPLVRQALAADRITLDIAAVALFFDMWEPLGSRQVSTSQMPVLSLFTRHDIGLSRDAFDAVPPSMKGAAPDFVGSEPRWWRFALNRQTGYPTRSAPAILDGGVFVADDRSRLWRHDARTGEVSWCVESLAQPRKGIVQLLQAVDGSVVYGCYDGTLTRVRAADGEILWRWRLDSSIHATPWVDVPGGRVYVNTEQWNEGTPAGHLQCLDWATGRVLWKQRHGWWPPGSAALGAREDIVVAPCNDGSLGAWTASTGEPLWKRKDAGLVRGRPLVHEGRVLLASEQGRLHCWDLRTGEPLWNKRYGKPLWHQFVQAEGGEVLVLDGKWHLSAFDLQSGALRWLSRLRSAGCWMPVRCGRHLVVLSRDGHLAVVDPAQQVKVWEGRLPGTFEQPPAVGEGLLVAAGTSGPRPTTSILPMSIEAVTAGGARDWIIVAQVKSYRVVYFTDDPQYQPPMQGDWYYVSPYQGELPKGMTLRNCWRWRFNGMEFADAGQAKRADAEASLLRHNQQALLDLLAQRINAIRKPLEPSSTAGAELRAQKLAEARAWLAAPGSDVPLLAEAAAAHRCGVGDMALRIVALDQERRRVLVDSERTREAIAAAVRGATTQQELALLRQRILEEVAAEQVEPLPARGEHTTPAKNAAPLEAKELEAEQLRLRLQLRNRINDLRRPCLSHYLLDDQVLLAKAEIAAIVHKAGGALPPGVDGTALVSHAAARGQRLAEAARDVLQEAAEIRHALLETEQMKDAVMVRIAAVKGRADIKAVEKAIGQLQLAPVEAAPAKAAA